MNALKKRERTMKLRLESNDKKSYLTLQYEGEEWDRMENQLKTIGLEQHRTANAFGLELTATYYRSSGRFIEYLIKQRGLSNCFDDINSPPLDTTKAKCYNLCVFRIQPDKNLQVKIPLEGWLTIADIEDYLHCFLKPVLTATLSVVCAAEIKIKFKD